MNTGLQISLYIGFLFYLDMSYGLKSMTCIAVLFSIFGGASILFSIVAIPTCSCSNRALVIPFFSVGSHFSRCEIISCAFHSISLMIRDI